ncbi:glycine/betaine ABC transporter, partial [Vibrio sp. 404]
AMAAYGLDDWRLVAGSDAAMSKTLEAATERQDPIVVTAWAPHPVFSGQSLRYLEDPQGLYSQEESIHTITRLGLAEEMPEAAAILDRFAWS